MKIEIEYLIDLLDLILANDKPDFTLNHKDIKPLLANDEALNNLVFHMKILEDQGFIESSNKSPGIGFTREKNGSYTVSIIPLRLTAKGHEFASELSKPDY